MRKQAFFETGRNLSAAAIAVAMLFALIPFAARSQTFDYGNDWYKSNPNRSFIKLIVTEDGIYRTSFQDFTDAGFDLTGIDPATFQLFYRGRQVPIFVSQSGGQLLFLEFFGKRNDGRLDSIMYRDPRGGVHRPNLQPNIEYSLFSDESAYFLTWGQTFGQRVFTIFDPTYGNFTPEPAFRYTVRQEYGQGIPGTEYVRGGGNAFDSFYTLNSDYVTGEGYQGPGFGYLSPRTVTLATPFPANNGSLLKIKTRVFGRSDHAHILRVDLNGDDANPVVDTTFSQNAVYTKTYVSDHSANLTESSDLTFNALRANTDNNNVSWASISYDRLPDLGGESTVYVEEWSKSTKAYLRFNDVAGDDTVFVYDLSGPSPIRNIGLITQAGGKSVANVIIQNQNGQNRLFVATDKGIKKPRIEAPKLNRLFDPAAGAEFVIITHRGLTASAEEYARYRDSSRTVPLTTRIVYTDEIYDEYGYGTITSWAIKRFCKDALDNWTVRPRYFFILGKGPFLTRGSSSAIVPTFGYPATDYEFVGHYDQNAPDLDIEVGIGRMNAYNDKEALDYLEKVKEYEHTEWDPWMKRSVFLGGGENAAEQSAISFGLTYMLDIFENVPMGGRANYFQKSTSNLIDPTTASYHDDINDGVHLIHFFGHSTSNILDIEIKEPAEYTNFGRYPLMIAMGCYGGDFTGGESFGERWLKYPGRGCIGYLANSSAGYLQPLRDYGKVLYPFLYKLDFGESLGDVLTRFINHFADSLSTTMYRNHARQMNLQGDPALALYSTSLPDLEVNQASIYFDPPDFSAQSDSFEINIIVRNLGIATDEVFLTQVRHLLPGRTQWVTYDSLLSPLVKYTDTLSFFIKNSYGNEMAGANLFEVTLDPGGRIKELDKSNNQTTIETIIPGNVPAILFPADFAIVPDNKVSLKASAFFITREPVVNYVFELDTAHTFNSPARINSGAIAGTSGLVEWQVPITLADSQIYFWRVRLADITPSFWGDASFRYLPGKKGWSQATGGQFAKDLGEDMTQDDLSLRWNFTQIGARYDFSTRIGNYFDYSLNGSLVVNLGLAGFWMDGTGWAIIDPVTLQVVNSSRYGKAGAAQTFEVQKLRDAILNAREGHYVVVSSNRNPKVPTWPVDVKNSLKLIGVSDKFATLGDAEPFLVMGRKGQSSGATEIYSPNSGNKLAIIRTLISSVDEGKLISTRVGPTTEWKNLYWNWHTVDPLNQEIAQLQVYGTRPDLGGDTLLLESSAIGAHDLSGIDAGTFPYLRLEAKVKDSVWRTPPQVNNWRVTYEPVPDAVVDPVSDFEFRSDTIFEGASVYMRMAARNISDIDMDSLLVKFTVEREDRTRTLLTTQRLAPLMGGGAALKLEYEFPTLELGLSGQCKLIVEINPDFDQLEQHYFNNSYSHPFFVVVDNINPLLDVTFDGRYIINGDMVSPVPEIDIQVNDENRYLAMDDTSSFEIFIREGTSQAKPFERIFVGDDRVEWQPATLPENKARVRFFPGRSTPLPDGKYTLKVQGRDKKGNLASKSGVYYEIVFEVVSETSVTRVLNYPNPFSTSTRFVYTLTGSEIPEVFQIQIYTITGKMVKVIDLVELGEVFVGNHVTNYAWDGRDEYGDKLDNGVYVYRVVTRMNQEAIEQRSTAADQYFKNGWGKMVIMR